MEEAPVRFELVDINEILKTLPHRYPMLLIDRVIKIRTDYSAASASRTSPSTSRRFSAIFPTGRSIPA